MQTNEWENHHMAKAASLLFLRVSTGLLCVIWGLIRIGEPKAGIGVNTKYYGGILASDTWQYVWGGFLLIVGLLTILGLCENMRIRCRRSSCALVR